MSDKDEIKELFQKELGNYEAKVDPSLWNGIQSGLSGAAAAGGAATGMSIASKVIIGVVIATAATVSSVLIFSNDETKTKNQAKVETVNPRNENIDNSDTDINTDKLIESNVEKEHNEVEETTKDEEKVVNSDDIENNIVEAPEVQETTEFLETELENVETEEPQGQKSEPQSTTVDREEPIIEKKEEVKSLIADINIEKQDNQYVKFIANGENIQRIEWYFGDGRSSSEMSPEHFYEEPGKFEVVAIIHGVDNTKLEKTINVNVEVEGKFTKLPNAFTPNNDGQNDEFFVEFEGINELQLNIFNKQQEIIFSTNDPNFRWRGYDSRGERVPEGEYVYVIIAKDKAGNVINKYKTLTLTR